MKKLAFCTLLLFTSTVYAQVLFEAGYFITDSNEKVECLIKNMDWKNNPTEFSYKLTETGEVKEASLQTVKEFGLGTTTKYVRFKVAIDKSTENTNQLDYNRQPVFEEELLFLESILEGKASLYYYENGGTARFFYETENTEITQLVYKKYLKERNLVGHNNYYKQQLYNSLKCESISAKMAEGLSYSVKSLKRFFMNYHQCENAEFEDYAVEERRDLFNLTIRPGINYSSLVVESATFASYLGEFDSQMNFRLGLELELILPFNKNKWGLVIEPTYQSYSAQKVIPAPSLAERALDTEVDYQSIELPIGIRYYLFLNENSRFFANVLYTFDFVGNSDITQKRLGTENVYQEIKLKSRPYLMFGVGYKYLDRYSIELRLLPHRDVLYPYLSWSSDYQTTSLILGYTLF